MGGSGVGGTWVAVGGTWVAVGGACVGLAGIEVAGWVFTKTTGVVAAWEGTRVGCDTTA